MDAKMQQDIAGICPTVSNNSMDRRDMNICYDDRRVQVPPQHMQPSYYKFQNEIVNNGNNMPEMPTAAHWWRESSEVFNNPQAPPPAQPETGCAPEQQPPPPPPPPSVPQTSQGTSTVVTKPKPAKRAKTDDDHHEPVNRSKQPEKWKVNVKKNARLRGEAYVGVGGKIVPAKVVGPVCDCRMRCGEKIGPEARRELHEVFWKTCTWEQRRQYIALLVKESAKQRSRARADVKSETRRQVTFTYSLLIQGDFITVCKPMFLNTFSISEKLVRIAMDKKRTSPGGIIGPDQRGRHTPKSKKPDAVRELVREHIKSFPADKISNTKDHTGKRYLDANLSIAALHKLYVKKCEETGVPPSDIVKESYYRRIFKTEFNLGFKTVEDKNKTAHSSSYSNKGNKP